MIKERGLKKELPGITRGLCEHRAIVDGKSARRNTQYSVSLLGWFTCHRLHRSCAKHVSLYKRHSYAQRKRTKIRFPLFVCVSTNALRVSFSSTVRSDSSTT